MELWVKCTRNSSDNYSCYEGMDEDTVTGLLIDLGCSNIIFLSHEDWNTQQGI